VRPIADVLDSCLSRSGSHFEVLPTADRAPPAKKAHVSSRCSSPSRGRNILELTLRSPLISSDSQGIDVSLPGAFFFGSFFPPGPPFLPFFEKARGFPFGNRTISNPTPLICDKFFFGSPFSIASYSCFFPRRPTRIFGSLKLFFNLSIRSLLINSLLVGSCGS